MEDEASLGKLDGWEKGAKAAGWKPLHKNYNIIYVSKCTCSFNHTWLMKQLIIKILNQYINECIILYKNNIKKIKPWWVENRESLGKLDGWEKKSKSCWMKIPTQKLQYNICR